MLISKTHFIENNTNWNHSTQCASFRLRLYIFLSLILCWHCLLQSRMLMKNCRCCVFKFLFLLHSLWLLASVKSHLLMNESRFICSCLIVYWCRSIFLFFFRCCMLNEICFDWNYKTWKRWNFVIIFELSKCRIFAFFCFLEVKSLFSFCCYLCCIVLLINYLWMYHL